MNFYQNITFANEEVTGWAQKKKSLNYSETINSPRRKYSK